MSETMAHRIQAQAQSRPHAPAYYVKSGGSWVPTDWSTYAGEVRTVGRALVALGIDHGDAVGILGFNTPDWVIMDCAAFSVGAVPAGIYTTCSSEEVEYILQHSEAKVALVRNVMQWEKVQQVRERLPKLEKVVTMRGCPAIDDPMVISWETFCGLAEGVDDTVFDTRMAELKPDQLATLIYTSGTTGPPKGVMLTHDNLAYTADLGVALSTADSSDCALSYLPLSHIAEQMFSIHVAGTAGYAVYYATSIDDVAENLKEVQPTVFFGVPRIWEKFYAGLSSKLSQATGAKLKLVTWARGVGTKVSGIKNNGGQPTGLLALQYRLADKLIFSKIKPAVGLSRAKIAVSGAAPITREVLEFMASLDILVSEVYGQSEGSGPTSFNSPGKTKFGT
ncbi:MAG: long-chain acyl-CoA synthetase, partial [Bradymonadia bacterium]